MYSAIMHIDGKISERSLIWKRTNKRAKLPKRTRL